MECTKSFRAIDCYSSVHLGRDQAPIAIPISEDDDRLAFFKGLLVAIPFALFTWLMVAMLMWPHL